MPQRIRDFGVAVLALAAAFTALALIDERVPDYLKGIAADVTNGRIVRPGSDLGNAMALVSSNPALDNIFVVGMVAGAVVLLVLMVRT